MSVLARIQERTAPEEALIFEDTSLRRQLKHDLVERLGLEPLAHMAEGADRERARSELKIACQALVNTGSYAAVDETQRAQIVEEVLDEILGLGPLQPLLDDASITEVMVNGVNTVFFERAGALYPSDRVFESTEQIMGAIDRILAPLGRRVDERSPVVNARLANGDRVNVVIPPVGMDGPYITIRKFSQRISTLAELIACDALPVWYAQLLSWAVRLRQDIAVAGGTGSGKTTLLNALSSEIAHTERIITIEDSAELRFDTHPHVVRLEARDASIEGVGEVSIRDLVKNALRQRPDRIVVGEVRGEECIDMLQAMNTGHDGSLTTLHAGTPREAILRLVLMARFGLDLPVDVVEEQIASGLDLLVMSRRMADGSRVISTTSEVRRAEGGGVELNEIVGFDIATRSWQLKALPQFLEEACNEGLLLGEEVEAWQQDMRLSVPA